MAEHFPGTRPAGDPAGALADAFITAMGRPGLVGLLSATGYMEDHQVVAFLARVLAQRGYATVRAHPRQVIWNQGYAAVVDATRTLRPLDALVRFYQGEWLADWPVRQGWPCFFRGGTTPVCNPGTALVIESKRFPLIWDQLGQELPTWHALLPQSVDPRRLGRRISHGWVLKTAFCNTGDTVVFSDDRTRPSWHRAARDAWLWPGQWVAQRRFECLSIPTPRGPMYPCLGVYTINGRAAGLYCRMASRPFIDYAATEVAVLLDQGDCI
jgi:hypothetical protein